MAHIFGVNLGKVQGVRMISNPRRQVGVIRRHDWTPLPSPLTSTPPVLDSHKNLCPEPDGIDDMNYIWLLRDSG
jgi:hypothetical protein